MFDVLRASVALLSLAAVVNGCPTGNSGSKVEARAFDASWSPPYYPSPKGGTVPEWADAYAKARELVSRMSLLEKVNITTGTGWEMGPCVGNSAPATNVGFPALCLQDGPLGIRYADMITSWPAGITVSGTWDKDLMYMRGAAHGAEARAKGINVVLGPSMNPLGRHPAGGRNWEGFGSDPYLQGINAAQNIKGIQSNGVIATAKHYIANEQEHFRQGANALSSNIDDRTMHELYLWPFAESVHAGVGAVMCAYNQVNNSASCQNSKLLNGLLKDELGFQGFVMSDWGAQYSGVASVLAGLDMTMPGDGLVWDGRESLLGPKLTTAALNGSIPLDRIDDMVTRIVATWYKLGQETGYPEPNFSSWTKNTSGMIYEGSGEGPYGVVNQHLDVRGQHALLARQIAADGTALLKNTGILPLASKPQKIGVYGSDAGPGDGPNACVDRGCNQGTLAVGWGSGSTDFEYLICPLAAITARAQVEGHTISSIINNTLLSEMATSAAGQDVCLVFINSDGGEGYITWDGISGDRNDLNAQLDGDNVVLSVANKCENTVVIVHSIGPIVMEKWADHENVKAIVWANLPGQESGNALVDVLWGGTNPSGKLPYTIGKSLADYGPTAPVLYVENGNPPQADFTEGLYVDYRYFDKNDITPRYEFGFGLSYTTFSYSSASVSRTAGDFTPFPAPRGEGLAPPVYSSTLPDPQECLFPAGFQQINRMIYPYLTSADISTEPPYPYPDGYNTEIPPSQAGGDEGGNAALWEELYKVSVVVSNTGKLSGAEVPQLYLEYPQSGAVDFPVKQLRGFEKVYLQAGESSTVTFSLTRRDVSYWNVEAQNWEVVGGLKAYVGSSSRSLNFAGSLA
ncbi:hypothetical protein RUND412_009725 [Rhizina undulata]